MKKWLSPQPIWLHTGLLIVRLFTGIFLIYHGWEVFTATKMHEYHQWPAFKSGIGKIMPYAGKIAELLAGILLFFGFLTRFASVLLAGVMLFITFKVGNGIIWYNDQHPFLFVLLAVIFFCFGPAKYSLDHFLFKEK